MRKLPALLSTLLGAGCATVSSVPPNAPREEVRMDPVVVRGGADPLTGLDGYDATGLLEKGNELFAAKDYERAAKVFEKLLETFPDSDLVPSALYNAGLAYEELSKPELALERYQRILDAHAGAGTTKDARFRLSIALGKLQRWKEVADNYWAIRQLEGLSAMDELEARVGTGVGLFMQDDFATAEREFMSAVRFHEDKSKQEYLPADYFVGQARFYLGEIAAREFERIALGDADVKKKGWEDMMGAKLEEKCDLLLRAQNNFIRAIRVGHPGWATASGYRIGSLYERLYDDVTHVPVPEGLGEEAQEYYKSEVRKKVSVLVTKAIKIYEQSLEMATRVGENNEWVDRTSKALERMKNLALEALTSG